MAKTDRKDKLRRRRNDGRFTSKNNIKPNLKYAETRKCKRDPKS
jgi:hypothetical protein